LHKANWTGFTMDYKDDPLAPFRERIIYPILILAALCLAPLAINNFLEKRYLGGLATSLVVAFYLVDARFIGKGRPPPIPFPLLLAPMAVAMGFSIVFQGFYGAIWAYPAVMTCYFVLSRRMANISAAVMLFGGTAMIYRYVDPGMAIRFLASFALTAAIVNRILGVVSELQRELMHQAIVDPLTGAFNRRHMDRRLAEAAGADGRKPASATILLIDIDHFKGINDRLGHASGDEVLKKIVSLIQANTRRTDQLFRMGGEEFLLLLHDTDEAETLVVAENLRGLVEGAGPEGDALAVTISIGISQRGMNESADEWMKKADEALYKAKKLGRNRVVCWPAAA
jgi:diguanylate cyclase (GGDEF)-like protein